MKSVLKKHALSVAVAGVCALASASASAATRLTVAHAINHVALAATGDVSEVGGVVDASTRQMYIIGLKEAPLALYAGGTNGLSAPPRRADGKLDVKSAASLAYVAHLQSAQNAFMANVGSLLGREIKPARPFFQFQHAFNGMVLELTVDEAMRLQKHPQVALVEGYKEEVQNTDAGPAWIGAPTIWDGSNVPGSLASRGAGVVVGIIDSGINIGSPSFATTDIDGYTHVNPLGTGVFLGWCDPANPNHVNGRDECTDKLIGGWDFMDSIVPSGGQEAPGFEDGNGHGSHTASTVAGNRRNATFVGANAVISGVAPRANVIAYDACYTTAAGQGTCPNTALLASINQVVADGIVDVVNYSISGGTSPWTDSVSQGFLAAQNAGTFVAASAGNGTAPVAAGSTNHVEPWVTTVAASTHNRAFFGNLFSVTAPASPPANAVNVPLKPGAAPPYIAASIPPSTPLIESPNFNSATNNDGCTAFAANTFQRAGTPGIALIHWTAGTSACGTIARVNAAAAGGAAAVILMADVPLNAAAGGTVPAYVLENAAQISAIRSHLATSPGTATAGIQFPGQGFPGTPDVMADFSLLGPSTLNLLKPDVTAPGVNILATVNRWPLPAGPVNPALNPVVGLNSGTSMSSPHVAGSAALLRAINRSWTPTQIKTALVSTGVTANVFKPNGTTPSDPFNRGGGRVDLTRAAKVGLVMDETGANFTAANPANGGSPQNLNLPSFQNTACVGTCSFPRTLRSTRTAPVQWTATVTGLPAGAGTLTPSTFTVANSATQAVTLNIDSTLLTAGSFAFGELVLTPNNATIPVQRFPIAVRPSGPDIAVSNTAGITVSAAAGTTTTSTINVSNTGNPTINWSLGSGAQAARLLDQPVALGNGFISARFAGATPANTGTYVADDVNLLTSATITSVSAGGFILPSTSALTAATAINVNVFADNGGVPAGAPEGFGAAPVYAFSAAANATGISVAGNNIAIDLVAAGAPALNLPAGRFWITVWPNLPGTGSGGTGNPLWAWRINGVGTPTSGLAPQIITPAAASPAWAVPTLASAPGPGPASGFTAIVGGSPVCGASYVTADVNSGTLGATASQPVVLTFDATSLAAGTYTGYVCVLSNGTDPDEPNTLVPYTFTVTAPLSENVFADGFEDAIN